MVQSKNSIIYMTTWLANLLPLNEKSTDHSLKDQSGVEKIVVKKQPYQLLNTNREFFQSFDAANFHNSVNESS